MRILDIESEHQNSGDAGGDWISLVGYFLLCSVVLAVAIVELGNLDQKDKRKGTTCPNGRVYVTIDEKGCQIKQQVDQKWRDVSKNKFMHFIRCARKRGKRIICVIPNRHMETVDDIDFRKELKFSGIK